MNGLQIGCCGFAKNRKTYFQTFSLVEVQQTFYRLPQLATVQKWREEAPENFIFTLKAWQGITHLSSSPTYRRAALNWPAGQLQQLGHFQPTRPVFKAWEQTRNIALALKARVILFQCPPNFKQTPQAIKNLRAFFTAIDQERFVLAIEFRANWKKEIVKELCTELNLIHCVDPFKELPQTSTFYYFRLHGAPPGKKMYRYTYTDQDLRFLKQRLNELNAANEVFCLFNNFSMFNDAQRFKALVTTPDA